MSQVLPMIGFWLQTLLWSMLLPVISHRRMEAYVTFRNAPQDDD